MFEDAIKRYGLIVFLCALLFQITFTSGGIYDYIRIKSEIRSINASMAKLEKENSLLKSEIERLQNDDSYLEEVARKKFGFVREGERVYRIEK